MPALPGAANSWGALTACTLTLSGNAANLANTLMAIVGDRSVDVEVNIKFH